MVSGGVDARAFIFYSFLSCFIVSHPLASSLPHLIISKSSAASSALRRRSSLRSDCLIFLLERGCSPVPNVSYGRPPGSSFISFLVCVRCFIHLSIKFSRVCDGGLAPALSTAIYFLGVPVSPVLYGNVRAIIRTEIKKCLEMKVFGSSKLHRHLENNR